MALSIFTDDILSSVANVEPGSITGFLPMVGQKYSGELMVVGRAVNGWTHAPQDLVALESRMSYASAVHKSVTENMPGECPMSWVTACWSNGESYNTRKSAFWRVIRLVVRELSIADVTDESQPWPSNLVWSNLYKVAPVDGGNPGGSLRALQRNGCVKLLEIEVKNFQPRRLLFLTGYSWVQPFISSIWEKDLRVPGYSYVEGFGQIQCGDKSSKVVIASHPQGKNEKLWVSEVVSAFISG
jgi:hypothetical protein